MENPQLYENIQRLIASKNYDSSLSNDEKENLFGCEIILKIIIKVVDDCPTYRNGLNDFKEHFIAEVITDSSSKNQTAVKELIDTIEVELKQTADYKSSVLTEELLA